MKKSKKSLFTIGIVLLAIVLGALVFITTSPVFGVFKLSDADIKNYEQRAANFYDGRFHNETELSNAEINEKDPNKSITTGKDKYPEEDLPVIQPSFGNCPSDDVEITWYGHTTFLITMHGLSILVDPVFSDYLGLNKLLSGPRFEEIHYLEKDLPNIDICILTHDHFDHLDYQTIKELDDKISTYIVPLGVDYRLEKFGVNTSKIKNMAWWEENNISGLNIACTPAQHTSTRIWFDKKLTLWCSYVFYDEYHKIFLTGDSGFASHYEEIHNKYGDMDFVMTDGAQFGEEKDKHTNHMFPEESAKAVSILGAKKAMIMHWGSFCISDWHAWDDPPYRFGLACDKLGIDYISPKIGQTFRLSNTQDLHERWWTKLK